MCRTSPLLLLLGCYFLMTSATIKLQNAIFTAQEPMVNCLRAPPAPLLYPRILDCHNALKMIDKNLKEQQWELVRDVRNRELQTPSRTDKVLGRGRFRLPAAIFSGGCLIMVDYHIHDFNKVEPVPEPQFQLSTMQYFHFWGERVKNSVSQIITRCVATIGALCCPCDLALEV